jgi:hypothetical protein
MWLLDLPIPENVDGRVMREFVDAERLAHRPPTSAAGPQAERRSELEPAAWDSPEEEQEVLERLRSLGYLE